MAAATSKTFRSLARICGAAPVGRRPAGRRGRSRSTTCSEWIPKLSTWTPDDLAALPGVSPSRTHQIVPGRARRRGVMDIFDLDELQICPWALREGVILERLDQLSRREDARR